MQQGCPRNAYTYIVQEGDTLPDIAAAYNTTVTDIQNNNPNATNPPLVGSLLCIPIGDVSLGSTPGNVTEVTPSAPNTTVQPTPPTITITPGTSTVVFTCASGYGAQEVRTGQTYADLLIDNNVSYQAMRSANPYLDPSRLTPGAHYCAPPSGARQLCSRYRTYRLQEGDTLGIVAARLRTTAGRLLMLNPTMLPTDFTSGALICVP